MMNETTLKPGQTIQYDGGLWRVELVNPSRAYIVPLTKQHVVLGDREFDRTGRGVSIGANSSVEIVEDLERARTEMELAAAERELGAARRALQEQDAIKKELVQAEAELAALTTEAGTQSASAVRPATSTAGGWRLVGTAPFAPAGSLKRAVLDCLTAQPGAGTKQVAAACAPATAGAVAACLDRFNKAGVLIKG